MDELEKLKVLIQAELGPYQKDMEAIKKETQNMAGEVEKQTSKVKNAFSGIGSFVKRALIGIGALKLGKDALGLASDAKETESVVDLAFGNMRKYVDDFAKNSIRTHGMSALSAKQTAGDYMLMSQGMGMVDDKAAQMSVNIAKLSADMASMKNTSQEMAKVALSGIWTGETEALKKYGVVMTQANLEEYAHRQGIQGHIQDMTQQQQVMLRYAFVMDAMKMAQGDFARTSDGWAGQTKILTEQWKELIGIIGNGLMVVLLPVLRFINQIMAYLIAFARAVGQVFAKLFGIKGPAEKASSSIAPIGKAAGGTSKNLNNLGSNGSKNLDKVGKAADKAGKKAKGALASFDQLNVLTQPSAEPKSNSGKLPKVGTGGIGSAGVSIPTPDIAPIFTPTNLDFSKMVNITGIESFINNVKEKLRPFIDIIKSIDFGPLGESLGRLWESIKPILSIMGDNFAWILNEILGPFAKWFIEEIAPVAIDIISAALDILEPILDSVSRLGKQLWDNFLEPVAKWTAEKFLDAIIKVRDLLREVGDWMKNNRSTVDDITKSVVLFFGAWKIIELMSFIAQSGGVIAALTALGTAIFGGTIKKIADIAATIALNAMYAGDFIRNIVASTGALIANAAQWVITTGAKIGATVATIAHTAATVAATAATWLFNAALAVLTSPITLVVLAIAALIAIVVLLVKNWDKVKETASRVWEGIKQIWNIVANWFDSNVIQPLGRFFSNLWTGIKQTASDLWNGLKGIFSNVANWFDRNVIQPIGRLFGNMWNGIKRTASDCWDGIVSIFSAGGRVFNGIKEGIVGVFKTVVNWLIGGINSLIAVPFKTINGILNSISGISIAGIEPFSWIGYNPLPVPQIPKLSVGTNYVAREGLAYIHEGEAVVPKKYNPALGNRDEEEKELLREQNSLLRALLEKDNSVYLDGDELKHSNDKRERDQYDRFGYAY